MGNCQKNKTVDQDQLQLSEDEKYNQAVEQHQQQHEEKVFQLAQQKEYQILEDIVDIQPDTITIKNVTIKLRDGSFEWIHTFIYENEQNKDKLTENLVLFHGYGGTALNYYKMIKPLSQRFKVICIDMLGVGLSSRPNFELTDPKKITEYFNYAINQWRIQLNLQSFFLAGHSFGGYIAGNFALAFPEVVQGLYLISPAGITFKTKEQNEQIEQARVQNFGFFKKSLFNFVKKNFNNNELSITQIANTWYIPTNYVINRYLSGRLQLPENETNLLKEYYKMIFKFPNSTEKAFTCQFMFPSISAKIPLQNLFPQNLKVNTYIIFGDQDWMNQQGAKQLNENQKEYGINIAYHILENSGHQIPFENPLGMAQYILETINEEEVSD